MDSCTCDFEDYIGKCVSEIVFNVGVTPATPYVAFITTPMGKIYQAEVTSDVDGNITYPADTLPAGLLNEYAGIFKFELMEPDGCDTIMLNFKKSADDTAIQYPFAYFTARGGNSDKNYIGCPQ